MPGPASTTAKAALHRSRTLRCERTGAAPNPTVVRLSHAAPGHGQRHLSRTLARVLVARTLRQLGVVANDEE